MAIDKAGRCERLIIAIDEMLERDETISLRSIMRQMPNDFSYPNAITRDCDLKKIYLRGREDQERIRTAARSFHGSRSALEAQNLRQTDRIKELEKQVQILVASHRALYSAVGELGGFAAWLRFFDRHQDALATLSQLSARNETVTALTIVADNSNPEISSS